MFDEDKVELNTSQQLRNIIFSFVKSLIDNDLLTLLVSNLSRLNEEKPDDKQGIYNTISLIENLVEINPTIADLIESDTKFIPWLLKRISENQFDSVRQYCCEVLEILVQISIKIRNGVAELGAVDSLLQVLSRYRKKDPAMGADEVEMVENIFNILCLLIAEPKNKIIFLKSEGFELMLLMIKYYLSL
jgi:beta-catenin-like protein 1